MKFKDYFSKLKQQGKITNEEFDKFLETVPEGEIPDALYDIIQDKFMTVDRALTHKDVYGKLKRENLDPIDNDIKKITAFFESIDKYSAMDIDKNQSTYDKLAAITTLLPKMVEKVKATPGGDNEEAKAKIKEYEKVVKQLTEKIEASNTEFTAKEQKLLEEFSEKEKSMKLDFTLENKARRFILAEPHEHLRDTITKIILSDLKSKHALAIGEKEEILVQEIENGVPRPKFNGNDQVTIDPLLEAAFEPYIKKSTTPDDSDKGPQVKSYPVTKDTKTFRQGRSTTVQ